MDIRVTRVVYSVFIVIFLIFSSYLIFYGLGYRFNFHKGRIEKTGALYLKSYPRDAAIYINNKLYKSATPVLINRLAANVYQIKVSKTGYFNWQKNLEILPRLTTFAEDIALFKNRLEFKSLIAGDYLFLKPSPNKERIFLIKQLAEGQAAEIYDLGSKKTTQIFKTAGNTALSFVAWCNSGQKAVLKNGDDFLVVNNSTGSVVSLKTQVKTVFNEIACDYFNDNWFYGANQNGLYKIDLLSSGLTKISEEKIMSFLPWQTKLFYITKSQQDGNLLKSLFDGKDQDLLVLPPGTNYKFISSANGPLAIHNQDSREAYLIYPEEQPIYKRYLGDVDQLAWHDRQLIYWNKSEIWVYFPDQDEKILIERSSQPIDNAFWHPGIVNIFGQISSQLKIYELDSRDQRNVYNLTELSPKTKDNLFINRKGDRLYLLTEIDGTFGLYQVEIQ